MFEITYTPIIRKPEVVKVTEFTRSWIDALDRAVEIAKTNLSQRHTVKVKNPHGHLVVVIKGLC